VDYILISKHHFGVRDVNWNHDEVSDIDLINLHELRDKVKSGELHITPWFRLIIEHKIEEIWNGLDKLDSIGQREGELGISNLI
jgi:isopentenyldiphosphate isomerase